MIIVKINILSILSKIPPWLPKKFEKSFICNLRLTSEKCKSPKNKETDKINDKKILKSK